MRNPNSDHSQLLDENLRLKEELAAYKKATEEHLANQQVSEQRFRLAMRGANDGIWDWNLETDEVYYSPRWKSMLGYQKDEVENVLNSWASLVHPNEKDSVLGKVDDYLSGRAKSFEVEMRMKHKDGHYVFVLSRAFAQFRDTDGKPIRLVGTHVDITARKKAEHFNLKTAEILEMIAIGQPASAIYDAIALMYESRHPGMRCSMLELKDGVLLHGGAPSLPKEYCNAVHGLRNGPDVGSCGTSTYTGTRCLVENIETDPKWANIKDIALPYGMRSCWSEPIKSSKGDVLGAFGMYYDYPALPNEEELQDLVSAARLAGIVMERDHDQNSIRELAYKDILTGLASRAHFYQYVEDLISTSNRRNRQFSLLYIDLDNFKGVNDSLGHDTGDLLLKEVALRLSKACREIDFIARLSGDEFCIVVEDMDDAYGAGYVAQRCFETVSQPINLLRQSHLPTCSIGIAHYPSDGGTISALLKAADTALYSAKELGKNRYAFYEPELTQKAEYRFYFDQSLRKAIEKQSLSLVYQPQVDSISGEILGVEALARWHHPDLGQVPPLEFIKVAERIGMIKPFTEWVLYTACNQAQTWKTAGLKPIRMAVNVSLVHSFGKDLLALVERVVNDTGMQPGLLELEVTQSAVQTNPDNLSIFKKLKDKGFVLAIDDFGIGYSSLAALKHLAVDRLKLDKSFIDDIAFDSNSEFLVSSMISIGHNLGFGIVAKGVENTQQLSLLQQLRCETVQGYLFSKPVDAKKIHDLLKHGVKWINSTDTVVI